MLHWYCWLKLVDCEHISIAGYDLNGPTLRFPASAPDITTNVLREICCVSNTHFQVGLTSPRTACKLDTYWVVRNWYTSIKCRRCGCRVLLTSWLGCNTLAVAMVTQSRRIKQNVKEKKLWRKHCYVYSSNEQWGEGYRYDNYVAGAKCAWG